MSTIGKLLQWIDPIKREALSDILAELQKTHGPKKWRVREIIANQMSLFVDIFSEEVIVYKIVPITVTFSNDQVAAVRKKAAQVLPKIFDKIEKGNEIYMLNLIEAIKYLASSNRFNQRQT